MGSRGMDCRAAEGRADLAGEGPGGVGADGEDGDEAALVELRPRLPVQLQEGPGRP